MADRKLKPAPLKPSVHANKPSLDTNASGLAESAISYSAFPEPPSSIPTTPIRSVFGESPSPSVISPLFPGPVKLLPIPSPNRFSHSTFGGFESTRALTSDHGKRDEDLSSLSPSTLSPYDWHEGASSIDVDAAEDRLLPTSFITTLLKENAGPRGTNRASYASDAISGISEMTYPPKQPYINSLRENLMFSSRVSSHRQSYRGPLPRPIGGRAPSSHLTRQTDQKRTSVVHEPVQGSFEASNSHSERAPIVTRSASVLSQSTLVAEPERGGKYEGKLAVHDEVDESDDNIYPADVDTNSSSGFPTHQTNLRQQQPVRGNLRNPPFVRESIHSTKSGAPSFKSRISSLRSIRRAFTWRRKPLPPLPIIPHIPIAKEQEHRRMEEATSLPDLVNRADRLHGLLEKGYHPHHSISSFGPKTEPFISSFDDAETVARYQSEKASHLSRFSLSFIATWVKERKIRVIIGIIVLITAVVIGTAVGVTATANKTHKGSCPPDIGGASCNLNASCVCTTTSEPCENPVAQAVLDLIPVMNDYLSTNFSRSTVYNSLWIIQGSIQGSSCVEQVDMIDTSPALSLQSHPNRTQWAQVALLWTLTQTQDSAPVTQLQDFIEKAPWTRLNFDGPITSAGLDFTTSAAGFEYDFAAQTITPLPSTFTAQGQPINEQIAKIDKSIVPVLDRIYSYAVASSKQRDQALLTFWTSVLHQREDALNLFKAAFSSSPIILPIDGTSQLIRSLYNGSISLPPPIACYPALGTGQRELIAAVEEKAFNLSPAADAPQVNSTCFPQHPTYGIFDVLRLRLPFFDSRNDTTRQGLVLNSNVSPRAVLAVGEALSALPRSPNVTRTPDLIVDPRNYGTTAFASHIILQYLSSMPVNMANAIIYHILNLPTPIPPPTDSTQEPFLFPIESIPVLEVAVFGDIQGSDAGSYLSSFTTSSGSLFFGSNDGTAFRTWAIGRGGNIAWTENATSPEVVHDNSFSDNIFNLTWIATSTAIDNNVSDVGLSNITESFRQNQRFSP